MNWTALIWQIPIGIAVLSLLVLVHELGHFVVARRTGTTVQTFSIGFEEITAQPPLPPPLVVMNGSY